MDLIAGYWQSPDGKNTVDMDGNSPGLISTLIDVPSAGQVTIGFDLAGNPDGQSVKYLQVGLGASVSPTFTFDSTGHSEASMGWVAETATFTRRREDAKRKRLNSRHGFSARDDGGAITVARERMFSACRTSKRARR